MSELPPSSTPRAWRTGRWLLARFGLFVGTVFGAAGLVLTMLWLAPGDAIDTLPNGEQLRPVLEAEWGLNDPLPARYAGWVARSVRGDLGTSLTVRPGAPVAALIAAPAARSLLWAFGALFAALAGGVALAAVFPYRAAWVRPAIAAVSITPLFLLAHLVVSTVNAATWAAMGRGWIARPDWFALPDQESALRTAIAVTLLAVGSGALADVYGETEALLGQVLRSPYVDAARARGMSIWPHAAWNLVPPLAGVAVSRAGFFVGGLVILEKVLLLNGVGSLLWQAAILRDYNLALGITVVLAAAVAAFRFAGDVLRALIDPRIGRSTP